MKSTKSFRFIAAVALVSVENCMIEQRDEKEALDAACNQLRDLAKRCLVQETGEDPIDVRFAFEAKANELQMPQNDPCLENLYRHLSEGRRYTGIRAIGTDGREEAVEIRQPVAA